MLEIETVSKVFGEVSYAGDELRHNDRDSRDDSHLAHAIFKHSEGEVDIYVYLDGTYEVCASSTYRLNVAEVAACWRRAEAFTVKLQIKQRTKL